METRTTSICKLCDSCVLVRDSCVLTKPRWTKRKQEIARAERMRGAKMAKLASNEVSDAANTSDSSMNQSFVMPQVHSSEEDSDLETEFNETAAKEVYSKWIASQSKTNIKMLVVMLMDIFLSRFGMGDVGAATEVGIVVGCNQKTVRMWWHDFYGNGGCFSE